jgi:selenide,water dikinase
VVRNSTARPGDLLILTKPLGTGIVSTAIKGEMAPASVVAEATRWMTLLNREAAELMVACGATAATDVTGFGFIGHACEMALGAAATFSLELSAIPLFAGLRELIADGLVPAGCYRNRDFYAPLVSGADPEALLPHFDPQTSGGLLIALPEKGARDFLARSQNLGAFAVMIGEVLPKGETPLVFV